VAAAAAAAAADDDDACCEAGIHPKHNVMYCCKATREKASRSSNLANPTSPVLQESAIMGPGIQDLYISRAANNTTFFL
jgi:hypothetical protein